MSLNKDRIKELTKGNIIYLKDYENGSCFSCNKCQLDVEQENEFDSGELIGICEITNKQVDLITGRCGSFI